MRVDEMEKNMSALNSLKYLNRYKELKFRYHMHLERSWIKKAYYEGEEFFGAYLKEQKPYKTSQKPPFSYIVRLFRKLFIE